MRPDQDPLTVRLNEYSLDGDLCDWDPFDEAFSQE
jgi:hypothetical protein